MPRAGRRSPLEDAFIAFFLVFQLALPISHYVGLRATDDRFAWRMYSSVRLQRCRAAIEERRFGAPSGHRVDADREIGIGWRAALDGFNRPVVRRYLERRCRRDTTVETVHYARRCLEVNGAEAPLETALLECAHERFVVGERPG